MVGHLANSGANGNAFDTEATEIAASNSLIEFLCTEICELMLVLTQSFLMRAMTFLYQLKVLLALI